MVLWFDRAQQGAVVPDDLAPYITGQHHLSTKQVPTSTLLRHAGSASVGKNLRALAHYEFSVQDSSGELITSQVNDEVASQSGYSSSLGKLLEEAASENDSTPASMQAHDRDQVESDTDQSDHESTSGTIVPEVGPQERKRRRRNARLVYSDPWKIHAGRVLAEVSGISAPRPLVWQGDGLRLQDPIPPRLLGPKWSGSKRNSVRFSSISDQEVKLNFLFRHTHWGHALSAIAFDQDHEDHAWAKTLKKRVKSFIKGGSDPLWSKRKRERLLAEPDKIRDQKSRSDRLLELLKTVDGIFLQRYFAYPEEVWTWEKFDMFTLKNIEHLIGDEFLDGELTEHALSLTTTYESIKGLRKSFKDAAHRGDLGTFLTAKDDMSEAWERPFLPVYRKVMGEVGHRKTFLIGLLSQTRGAGTPPPLVLLKSKTKFLRTVSSEPDKYVPTQAALVRASLENILQSMPGEAFTGLSTKARVSVTTSASWEETKAAGGTTEAISALISFGVAGVKVPTLDLDTGVVIDYQGIDTLTTGEYIFWSCLQEVRRTPLEELRYAFLTMVKEPGKGRTVTKARAYLKVILDLVSRICAIPMKKGIDSSSSGMSKAHHGWNLFLNLMSEEMKETVFEPESTPEQTEYGSYVEVSTNYRKTYASSTDFEEATDQLSHDFAELSGNAWMLKCGIPRILRLIVHNTCYKQRRIFFLASGPLVTIGREEPDYGNSVRSVLLRKGVLMGDPLTKIVLHLANLVVRDLSNNIRDPNLLKNVLTNPESFCSALSTGVGIYSPPRKSARKAKK